MMKPNDEILTPEIRQKLSELRRKVNIITSFKIEDLSSEIDAKRSVSFQSAMMDEMRDMDDVDDMERFAHSTEIDDIMISREAFFDNIIQEKASEVLYEIQDLLDEVRKNMDRDVSCRIGVGYKVEFYKGNFVSSNHDEVKKHILKRENKKYGDPFIRKSGDGYQKQKEQLGKILDVDTSAHTLTTLNKYEFLDSNLADIVKKMYYCATEQIDNYITRGKEINHYLEWLGRDKLPKEAKEVDVVALLNAKNAKEREKNRNKTATKTPTANQPRG